MSPTAVPTRITIDFRDAVHPSRSWILGLEEDVAARVELLAFGERPATTATRPVVRQARPSSLSAECACPDFCERDHANE